MSLRIRRGTESDRQSTLFDLGEIVYTTDTKKLYIGDGTTTGGVHVLANSTGNGLAFNSTSQTIGFNLSTLSLSTQITPESYTTTYTSAGSSGTTLKVASTVGIQAGMTVNGTGFTTQTVAGVVDGVTLTLSAAPGNSPAPVSGETLTFSSTNQYFTSARMLTALNAALTAGTQTGISFNFSGGALSATVASALPSNASGVLTNNGSGTLSWTSLANYALLNSPTFTTPSLGAATATSLSTTQSSFNLLTSTATTVNAFTAATAVNIGSASGVVTFAGDIAIDGSPSADITTTSTTATVFNSTATTLSIGGAATAVGIGASTGTTTVNNALIVTGNLTVNGTTTTVTTETGTSFVASNGLVSTSSYSGSYSDGIIVDYVSGNGRISVGTADGITFYNGTDVARTSLLALTSNGNVTFSGSTLSSTSTTVNAFNSTATTLNIGGAATTLNLGVTGGTTTINGHVSLEGTISTGATGTGAVVFATTPTLNTPSISTGITTSSTTFNLVNATATTVNFAGAATAVNIGASTGGTNSLGGITTINNVLSLPNALTTSALSINTTALTFNVFNTNATTVNAFGAATTIYEGAAGIVKYVGQSTGNTILSLLGNGASGTATLTTNVTSGTANIFAGVTGTINIGTTGSTVYHSNISRAGLDIAPANYITVSSSTTYALSTSVTDNILLVTTTALTATLTFPPSPVDGQRVKFSVTTNTVTLALTAGPTLVGTFAGSVTAPTTFTYVYRLSNTTWYRV